MDWRHWSVQMNSTNEHTADETKSLSGTRAGNMKLMRFVCKAHVLWLSIHSEWQHGENFLVAHVLAKTGVQRQKGLKRLTNLGSFHHNIDVLKKAMVSLLL